MVWNPGVVPGAPPAPIALNWTAVNPNVVVTRNNGAALRINCTAAGFEASYRLHAGAAWSNPPDSDLSFYVKLEIGTHHAHHFGAPNLPAGPMPSGKYALITNAIATPTGIGIGPVLLYALAVYAQQRGITWIRTGTTANPWWHNFLGFDPLNAAGDFNKTAEVLNLAAAAANNKGWNTLAPILNNQW